MLFFRQLKQDKLSRPDFRSMYEKECHICATTVQLASVLCDMKDTRQLQAELGVGHERLTNLIEGECCDPDLVLGLCRCLKMDDTRVVNDCPRLKR